MKGWKCNGFNFVASYFEIGQTGNKFLWPENNRKGKMRRWEVCVNLYKRR